MPATTVKLKQAFAAKLEQAETLSNKAADEGRVFSAEEQTAFDSAMVEAKSLKAQIAATENLLAEKAALAVPPEELPDRQKGATGADRKEVGGSTFTKMVLSLAAAKGDPARAVAYAEEKGLGAGVCKALQASTFASGGVLVPVQQARDVIEILRPMAVVRSGGKRGARVQVMPSGSYVMPRQSGGATASFQAEGAAVAESNATFDKVTLTARKMLAFTGVSNDLIRYADPSALAIAEDDLLKAIATREDAAFIRDPGSAATPKGLRYQAAAANIMADASASLALSAIGVELGRLELALMGNNVGMVDPCWFMAPRTFTFLNNLRDGNGNKAFPEMDARDNPYLRGYPVKWTSQIPVNLGGGGDESEIYLADMNDVVIGQMPEVLLDASNVAAYLQGATVVAAFAQDETVVRVVTAVDIALRHAESVAVLTEVDWL